jgi:hypothetical protein
MTAKTFLTGAKKASKQMDSKLDQRLLLWKEKCQSLMSNQYKLIECAQLVGLFQCIFVKSSFFIKDSSIRFVKTGLGGYHGNKGAIVTRFLIGDSSLCFVNCHLAAHQNQVSQRNNDIQQILKEVQFPIPPGQHLWNHGGDGSQILDHEMIFWNGDLNYRIDSSRNQVIQWIEQQDWNSLWV